jgi:hypothetical protein
MSHHQRDKPKSPTTGLPDAAICVHACDAQFGLASVQGCSGALVLLISGKPGVVETHKVQTKDKYIQSSLIQGYSIRLPHFTFILVAFFQVPEP